MNGSDNNPLVSFVVLTYNQERYIREALEGAFSQTYSPLEIIISDDCSTDNTICLINEMVAAYPGEHKVIVNINQKNLGIAEHINKVINMTNGELILVAAGDDISLPCRTDVIVAEWLNGNKLIDLIHSNTIKIDEDGVECGELHTEIPTQSDISKYITDCVIIGATQAWSRRLFKSFGPINALVTHEDRVCGFRARLLGDVTYIEKPLVKYRVGGVSDVPYSSTDELLYSYFKVVFKRLVEDCKQNKQDLMLCDDTAADKKRLLKLLDKTLGYYSARYALACGLSPVKVLREHPSYKLFFVSMVYLFPQLIVMRTIFKSLSERLNGSK